MPVLKAAKRVLIFEMNVCVDERVGKCFISF